VFVPALPGIALNFQIRHTGVYPLSLTEELPRLTTLHFKKSRDKMTQTLNMTARFPFAPRLVPTAMHCVALASALCCAGAAQAQATTPPTVTLYGLADVPSPRSPA
jgi:hypothetical protein